ncbi:MAG: DNA polymerase III subunit gamma/tau [Planctomycetota bacterium]
MAYQAMARRYRPNAFDEVIGQDHVARTLKNAIRTGRVAHAYLFCGPHGVGKTSMARILARALNCTGGPSVDIPPDCPISADILAGVDPDVQEIDGASNNSVDQVRTLREQAGYVPARARHKIYIIDEVHMLSASAFNALLKTLEEPPPHVKFVLATTEPHKLPETVLSRCQRFDFRLVPAPLIAGTLKKLCAREGIEASDDALEAVAAFAAGSVRDALVLLDQLASYASGPLAREDVERVRGVSGAESVVAVYEAILSRDGAGALAAVDAVARQGVETGDFLDRLIEYGRDLMLLLVTKSDADLSAYGPAREAVVRHAGACSLEQALLALDVFSAARVRVRSRALSNPLVPLEMAVARLAAIEGIESVGRVLGRIEALAQSGALSGGADLAANPRPGPPASSITIPRAPLKKRPAAAPLSISGGAPPSSPGEETPGPAIPASPTKAAAAPVPLSQSLTLKAVQDAWPAILEEMGKAYPPDRAYFHDVRPVGVEGDILVIELPAGGVFLLELLEERVRRARVADGFGRVLGRPVGFRMVLAEGPAPAEAASAQPLRPEREILQDPTVQEVMERFKGEILSLE